MPITDAVLDWLQLYPGQSQIPRSSWREPQRAPTEDLVDWQHLNTLESNPGMLVRDASYITRTAVTPR